MDTPLISVLMGVYYQQADIYLLKRSVTSILNQTEKDFELLICDDGSTPEACAYLESLASNDRRIQLIRSGDRFHLAKKLNACIKNQEENIWPGWMTMIFHFQIDLANKLPLYQMMMKLLLWVLM